MDKNDGGKDNNKKEDKEKGINDKIKRDLMKAFSLFTQLGLTMSGCVIIGVLSGKFLDWVLGTTPWLTVILAFVGSAAALKVLYDIGKDWK